MSRVGTLYEPYFKGMREVGSNIARDIKVSGAGADSGAAPASPLVDALSILSPPVMAFRLLKKVLQ